MKILVKDFVELLKNCDQNSYVLFSPDDWYRELNSQQPLWRIEHPEIDKTILVIALDDVVIKDYE